MTRLWYWWCDRVVQMVARSPNVFGLFFLLIALRIAFDIYLLAIGENMLAWRHRG